MVNTHALQAGSGRFATAHLLPTSRPLGSGQAGGYDDGDSPSRPSNDGYFTKAGPTPQTAPTSCWFDAQHTTQQTQPSASLKADSDPWPGAAGHSSSGGRRTCACPPRPGPTAHKGNATGKLQPRRKGVRGPYLCTDEPVLACTVVGGAGALRCQGQPWCKWHLQSTGDKKHAGNVCFRGAQVGKTGSAATLPPS